MESLNELERQLAMAQAEKQMESDPDKIRELEMRIMDLESQIGLNKPSKPFPERKNLIQFNKSKGPWRDLDQDPNKTPQPSFMSTVFDRFNRLRR